MKQAGKKKLNTVLGIIAAVCVIAVLALCGECAGLPLSPVLTADDVLAEKSGAGLSAVIDSSASRVMLLNGSGRVTAVLEAGDAGIGQVHFSALAIEGDTVYVGEYECFDDSAYICSERIVSCDARGNELETVLELTHDMADDRTIGPVIQDISVEDGIGTAACLNAVTARLSLIRFAADGSGRIDEQTLNFEQDSDAAIQLMFASSDSNTLIALGDSGTFYTLSPVQGEAGAAAQFVKTGFTAEEDTVWAADTDGNGTVSARYARESEDAKYIYDGLHILCEAVFLAACLYLAALAAALCVWFIVRCVKQRRKGFFRQAQIIVVVAAACVGITAFYNAQLVSHMRENARSELRGYTSLLSGSFGTEFEQGIGEYRENGILAESTRTALDGIMESSALYMAEAGHDVTFSLMACDEDENFFVLADSCCDYLNGEDWPVSREVIEEMKPVGESVVLEYRSVWGYDLTCCRPVFDDGGDLIGMVAALEDDSSLEHSIREECVQLLVTMLSSAVIVGFVLFEFKDWRQCFARRRSLLREGYAHAEFSLARPIMFLTVCASSVNNALLPVVVKEIAMNSVYANNDFLMSLPVTVCAFGYLLGTPLRKLLCTNLKLPVKTVLCGSVLCAAAAYTVAAFSVMRSALIPFTIAICLKNIVLSVASSYAYALPFYARDSKERVETNRSNAAAFISAGSIAALLAGTLADRFGNAAIQLLGAVFSAALLVFLFLLLPARKAGDTAAESAASPGSMPAGALPGRRAGSVLTDRRFIAVLLFMTLPISVTAGYKNYLFPLFANSCGMDKVMISDMIVLCNALAFFASSLTSRAEKSIGTGKILVCGGALLAGTFMLFVLNGTVVWAVIALIIATFCIKSMEPATSTFWQERALALNADRGTAQIAVQCFENGASCVRSSILGFALNVFGQIGACFSLGAYVGLSALLFALMAGKKKADREKTGKQVSA